MDCPVCNSSRVKVYNSRHIDGEDGDLGTVERYRECKACRSRWKTVERFENLIAVEGRSLRAERIQDGELHCVKAAHKLEPLQVAEIRQRAQKGEQFSALAERYGVTQGHIARIVSRTRWIAH